jgi:hypothetical protein
MLNRLLVLAFILACSLPLSAQTAVPDSGRAALQTKKDLSGLVKTLVHPRMVRER